MHQDTDRRIPRVLSWSHAGSTTRLTSNIPKEQQKINKSISSPKAEPPTLLFLLYRIVSYIYIYDCVIYIYIYRIVWVCEGGNLASLLKITPLLCTQRFLANSIWKVAASFYRRAKNGLASASNSRRNMLRWRKRIVTSVMWISHPSCFVSDRTH